MLSRHQNSQVSLQQHTVLSKESRNLFIGSLNCRGLAKKEKVQQLCQDIEHFKINILAVQETKIKGEEKNRSNTTRKWNLDRKYMEYSTRK